MLCLSKKFKHWKCIFRHVNTQNFASLSSTSLGGPRIMKLWNIFLPKNSKLDLVLRAAQQLPFYRSNSTSRGIKKRNFFLWNPINLEINESRAEGFGIWSQIERINKIILLCLIDYTKLNLHLRKLVHLKRFSLSNHHHHYSLSMWWRCYAEGNKNGRKVFCRNRGSNQLIRDWSSSTWIIHQSCIRSLFVGGNFHLFFT